MKMHVVFFLVQVALRVAFFLDEWCERKLAELEADLNAEERAGRESRQ